MLGSKFVKFFLSILKRQFNSSSIFVSFFIVMTHNSYVSFKRIHFLLWIKGSHQSSNSDTCECSGENLPNSSSHFPNHKSVFSSNFTSPFSVMKDNSSVVFKSNIKYFKFWRLSSARIKFHQIRVILETASQFTFKFSIKLQGHET